MQRKQILPIHTIIAFVVFISAALITSLFVYHLSHKNEIIEISQGNGTLFPVAKEIKQFDLITAQSQPFTQKTLLNHWTLLYFGFTHCPDMCPTTLSNISKIYPELQKQYPNLQVVLVTLAPDQDTLEVLGKYTQQFHADFIGVTGKQAEIRKLQSQLGVYSVRDDGDKENMRLKHTTSIFLINPHGQWVGMFKYGMAPAQLADAVRNGIQRLT